MSAERVTMLPGPLVLQERVGLEAFVVDDRCYGCEEYLSECVCDEPEDSERPTRIDPIPASEDCR